MTDAERIARASAKRERRAAREREIWRARQPDYEGEAAQLTDRHERAWHADASHEADSFLWKTDEIRDRCVDALLARKGGD